jgi:hypothetical protein
VQEEDNPGRRQHDQDGADAAQVPISVGSSAFDAYVNSRAVRSS